MCPSQPRPQTLELQQKKPAVPRQIGLQRRLSRQGQACTKAQLLQLQGCQASLQLLSGRRLLLMQMNRSQLPQKALAGTLRQRQGRQMLEQALETSHLFIHLSMAPILRHLCNHIQLEIVIAAPQL